MIEVSGAGYVPEGGLSPRSTIHRSRGSLEAGLLCSDATLVGDGEDGQ